MMKYFSSSATEVSCEDIHPWKVFANLFVKKEF